MSSEQETIRLGEQSSAAFLYPDVLWIVTFNIIHPTPRRSFYFRYTTFRYITFSILLVHEYAQKYMVSIMIFILELYMKYTFHTFSSTWT